MDETHNCWSCKHCIYDLDKGNFCSLKKKQLGGNYNICKPNDCKEFLRHNQ